jgi:anthranilate phosphoribosyltransferase
MKIILNRLFNHETLSQKEASQVIHEFSSGKVNPAHLSAFMTVYLMRPVTVEELTGFRNALMELCVPVKFDFDTIDVCGTGGDGKNTFNISTLSAFVMAGAGIKVAKHGNYGVSSVSGSSNVLEYFGYKFTSNIGELQRQIDLHNVCFMHAPLFHPALKHVAGVRKELGIKTFFNMLGPLVNPADPKSRLIGVFNKELARIYHYILQPENKNYAIVNSEDGYDEVSLTGDFSVFSHTGESRFSPADIRFTKLKEADLFGGNNIEEAAKLFLSILEGKGNAMQNSVVIANSAFGIQCASGKSFGESVKLAEDSISELKAYAVFKNTMNRS